MSVLLAALTYQDQPVRVLGTPDAPLFVAADVCAVLEIAEHRSATRDFEDDEKGVQTVHSPGGPQDMLVVTEAGLYRLIFASRKPVAVAFRRWVWHEVLPALRTTGRYDMHEGQTAQLGASDLRSLLERAEPILLREPANQQHVQLVQRAWASLLRSQLRGRRSAARTQPSTADVEAHQLARAPRPGTLRSALVQAALLGAIREQPGMSSNAVRKHAGVSKDAMAALWAMRQVGLVDFEEGPRHARRWFAVQQPQERIQ